MLMNNGMCKKYIVCGPKYPPFILRKPHLDQCRQSDRHRWLSALYGKVWSIYCSNKSLLIYVAESIKTILLVCTNECMLLIYTDCSIKVYWLPCYKFPYMFAILLNTSYNTGTICLMFSVLIHLVA